MNATQTRTIILDPASPDRSALETAAEILRGGGLVAFPTETVYGLGAAYGNRHAVEALYAVKERPRSKPFTVHISDPGMMQPFACVIPGYARELMRAFWPGPLTIILKSAGGTDAFRFPDNRIARMLIELCGFPLLVPSANRAGEQAPTSAAEVAHALDGKIDLLLDGGPAAFGVASTIVDATAENMLIVRQGALSREMLCRVCGGNERTDE